MRASMFTAAHHSGFRMRLPGAKFSLPWRSFNQCPQRGPCRTWK